MLLRFYPAVHPVLKENSLFHRPSLNCSDATKLEAIVSSDARFHRGAEAFRQFDRRLLFPVVGSSDATMKCGSRLS
jgi:hypothetical protein